MHGDKRIALTNNGLRKVGRIVFCLMTIRLPYTEKSPFSIAEMTLISFSEASSKVSDGLPKKLQVLSQTSRVPSQIRSEKYRSSDRA